MAEARASQAPVQPAKYPEIFVVAIILIDIHAGVNAIITDHPADLQQALQANEGRSDMDLVIDAIFN